MKLLRPAQFEGTPPRTNASAGPQDSKLRFRSMRPWRNEIGPLSSPNGQMGRSRRRSRTSQGPLKAHRFNH